MSRKRDPTRPTTTAIEVGPLCEKPREQTFRGFCIQAVGGRRSVPGRPIRSISEDLLLRDGADGAERLEEIEVEGRKRTYRITDRGRDAYREEVKRLRRCIADADSEPLY